MEFAIDPDAGLRAKSIVASLAEEYLEWLRADLEELDTVVSEARTSVHCVVQLRRKAHDIRGQGGSFGYPLLSRIADGMHKILVSQEGVLSEEGEMLVRELFETLRMIIDRRMKGDGDKETQDAIHRGIAAVSAVYGEVAC